MYQREIKAKITLPSPTSATLRPFGTPCCIERKSQNDENDASGMGTRDSGKGCWKTISGSMEANGYHPVAEAVFDRTSRLLHRFLAYRGSTPGGRFPSIVAAS
jgi:hypothetical protein